MYGKVGVLKMSKMSKTTSSQYTEDWLPITGIQNGYIICEGKQKVTGVKITPRNIFILDQQDQDNVMISLKNFYNMIDFEFWLVVADRPVDISVYMSQLQLLYNDATSPAIRKLILQDIDKGNMFTNNNIVDTEYFILFKDTSEDVLQKRVRMLINGLASCGLNASQVSNDDLRIILENFLNGGVNTEFGTVMPV